MTLGAIDLIFRFGIERVAAKPVVTMPLRKLFLGLDYGHRVNLLVYDSFFTVND